MRHLLAMLAKTAVPVQLDLEDWLAQQPPIVVDPIPTRNKNAPAKKKPAAANIGEWLDAKEDAAEFVVERSELGSISRQVYVEPDPAFVLSIARSHGFAAACERWGWKTPGDISQILAIARLREGKGSMTTEDALAVVRRTVELGSVLWCARALGIPRSRVYAAHHILRTTPPTLSSEQRSAATRAGLTAKGKSAGGTAATIH